MNDDFGERGELDSRDRLSIDVEKLGVDWGRQRALINRGIEERRSRVGLPKSAWAGALASAALAAIALLIWWRAPHAPQQQDLDQFFAEMEAISDNYVPAGLYVLNGYIDMQPDAEAMLDYIAPQEGSEEEL